MENVIRTVAQRLQATADCLPDARSGPNLRYRLADAVLSAFACFFLQSPSFLNFQRRLEKRHSRSNCHSLFGMSAIPSDAQIRNLLDGLDPAAFAAAFTTALQHVLDRFRLAPLMRLNGHLLIALDGLEFHKSSRIHCDQCSTRRTGKANKLQYFHALLAATIVAPGTSRALPLPPEFVGPQDEPDDSRPAARRKQDCETNAAKRWLARWHGLVSHLQPIYLGDALYATQAFCSQVLAAGADFIFVVKRGSHRTMFSSVDSRHYFSTGWLRVRHPKTRRIEYRRYRWQNRVPVRAGADAVRGHWVELTVRRRLRDGSLKQTYRCCFFTSLTVTSGNVARIARCGRTRWNIENGCFNTIARQGWHFKHNFGHGRQGLGNLLAVLNLLAFALHTVLDLLEGPWRLCRQHLGTRYEFFEELRVLVNKFPFPDWRSLWDVMLDRRPPPWQPGPATP